MAQKETSKPSAPGLKITNSELLEIGNEFKAVKKTLRIISGMMSDIECRGDMIKLVGTIVSVVDGQITNEEMLCDYCKKLNVKKCFPYSTGCGNNSIVLEQAKLAVTTELGQKIVDHIEQKTNKKLLSAGKSILPRASYERVAGYSIFDLTFGMLMSGELSLTLIDQLQKLVLISSLTGPQDELKIVER